MNFTQPSRLTWLDFDRKNVKCKRFISSSFRWVKDNSISRNMSYFLVTPWKINMESQKWRFGRWCSFSIGVIFWSYVTPPASNVEVYSRNRLHKHRSWMSNNSHWKTWIGQLVSTFPLWMVIPLWHIYTKMKPYLKGKIPFKTPAFWGILC